MFLMISSKIMIFGYFCPRNTSDRWISRPPFYTFSDAQKVYRGVKTVPWRFQNSFREAFPERSRKEVERSAQRRSEDAQRALRHAQRRPEDAQRRAEEA